MLNLNEFEVIKRETNEHYYRFTIEAKERPIHCTHCYWDNEYKQMLPIIEQRRNDK